MGAITDTNVIPLSVLRELAKEPVLPSDPAARQAQAERIRALVEGQPVHVRTLARAMLKLQWDRLSRRPTP